jgi:hypothetical protein
MDTFAYITVLDINHKPLTDATVISSGKRIEKSKEHPIYGIRKPSPYALWDLIITAKGYDTLRYSAPFLEYNDFFLLKKNDNYFYSSGRRVPIYRPNNMIYVYTGSVFKKNEHLPDPNLIRQKLVKLLDSLGLMITKRYFIPQLKKASWFDGSHLQMPQPTGDVYSTMCMFIVCRKDKAPIPNENSKELSGLRKSSFIEAAGPLFTHDQVNWSDPKTYNGYIYISFRCGEERSEEILEEFKLSIVNKLTSGYLVKIPAGKGYKENKILEKLSALKKDIVHLGVNGERPGSLSFPMVEPKDSLAFGNCKRYGYLANKFDQAYSLNGVLQVTNTTWHNVYLRDADSDQAFTTADFVYWGECSIPLRPGKSTFVFYKTLLVQNHYENDLTKFFTSSADTVKRSIGIRIKGCDNKSEEYTLTFFPEDLYGSDTLSYLKNDRTKCILPEGNDLQITTTDSFDVMGMKMEDGSIFLSGFIKVLNISDKTLYFDNAASGMDSVKVNSPYANCILKPGKAIMIRYQMKRFGQVDYIFFPLPLTFKDGASQSRTLTYDIFFYSHNIIYINK